MNHSESAHQHIGNRQAPIILASAALLLLASIAMAQGGYDLSWWTVGGGAAFSSGGGYNLGGSIGQPHAGALSGGPYTVVAGFWGVTLPPPAPAPVAQYLPLLLRRFAGNP